MEEILTISKKMVSLGDLVIIPKARYEEYLRLKQAIHFAEPSFAEKKRIETGRKEIKKGECLTLKELKNALGN